MTKLDLLFNLKKIRRELPYFLLFALSTHAFAKTQTKTQIEPPSDSAKSIDYAAGTYSIDPAHSKITATIPPASAVAQFKTFQGEFTFARPFSESKTNITIQVASLDSGDKQRDQTIRSKNVMDAAQFPKMTFISKSFVGTPTSFKVTGDLTIRGVSKEVIFAGKHGGHEKQVGDRDLAAIVLTGTFSRKDFGIQYESAGTQPGDQVILKIHAEGTMTDALNAPASK